MSRIDKIRAVLKSFIQYRHIADFDAMSVSERQNYKGVREGFFTEFRCEIHKEYGSDSLVARVDAYSIKKDKIYGFIENTTWPEESEYGSICLTDDRYIWKR